jgi:hypothetical protein
VLRYEKGMDDFHALFIMRARVADSALPWNAQELLFGPFKEVHVILISNSPINGGDYHLASFFLCD